MNWQGKRVLVTGIAGTVGQEILNQLLKLDVAEIVGIDNNESELFFIEQSMQGVENVRFILCDISDCLTLQRVMSGCDIVLHTAALKHVPLCEKAPRTAIRTNILGVENVIEAAYAANVKRVLFTSSDKAVNPTNVMGTSKLMGERLITAANERRNPKDPVFGVTRFGNVLGSRGSVIPLFRKQIQAGQPVTVTDKDMSRFIMTLEQAVNLVLDSAMMFTGGEVFVTKMPVIRILDLAQVMIEELAGFYGRDPKNIPIKIIGARPGEKLYEELLTGEEVRRTLECDDFFIVQPPFDMHRRDAKIDYPQLQLSTAVAPYTSANSPYMNKEDLRRYLHTHGLLPELQAENKVDYLKVVS